MSQALDSLSRVEIFADLRQEDRQQLLDELETLEVERGAVLVHEGEQADALFIVLSGRFAVSVKGQKCAVAEIGAGEPLGEIAFLAGGTRTATVTALRDSVVLRLTRPHFDRIVARMPSLWQTFTIAMARRLAGSNKYLANRRLPRPYTIAIVRAGNRPVSRDFIRQFVTSLSKHARVLVVAAEELCTPAQNVRVLTATSLSEPRTAALDLNELEQGTDHVVLVADETLSAWSERALRQADLLIAVGQHDAGPELSDLERRAAFLLPAASRRLVLVHEQRKAIRGTARWLDLRQDMQHHHVALDELEDFSRLVRFTLGKAVGLVACGGGAFTAIHVGIHKALRDSGAVIDMFGGSSGGAAMTAGFAMESTTDEIDASIHRMFVVNRALGRYTLPRYSLLDHTHFDRQLRSVYGDVEIEDLWYPFFAASTDLSCNALHTHMRGAVWEAVRSSGAIPALLPPFYNANGHMLVDGSLMQNVPLQAMQALKDGPNIVVSFEVPEFEQFPVDYRLLPGRGKLLGNLLKPIRNKAQRNIPGITDVLMRSLLANRQSFYQHLTDKDVLLEPPIPSNMSILDWSRHHQFLQIGHAWMMHKIKEMDDATRAILSIQSGAPATS